MQVSLITSASLRWNQRHTPQLCVVISITPTYLVWTLEHITHRTHSAPSCAMSPITDQQSHVYGFLDTASLCPADTTRERSSRPAGDKIPACCCEAWGTDRKCCRDGQQSQIGLLSWRDTHADSLGKNTWLHPEPWVRPDGKQVQTAANMSSAQRGQCQKTTTCVERCMDCFLHSTLLQLSTVYASVSNIHTDGRIAEELGVSILSKIFGM